MIVLPGLIETHWHMWNTLFRSFAGDEQAHGYFPTVARYGAVITSNDMYQGARLSAAEAIYLGMTTVHDWCHNIRKPRVRGARHSSAEGYWNSCSLLLWLVARPGR